MPKCKEPGRLEEPIFSGDYSFNTGTTRNISIADYAILITSVLITTAIGLSIAWKHRRRKSIDEFLLAGRTLSIVPTGMSLAAGVISGISYVGFPGLTYTVGSMEILQLFILPPAMAIVTATFMPVFYNLRITSAYAYLEHRFSRPVRVLGAIYFIILTLIYLSMVLYAPSTSVNAVTGLSLWGSILSVGIICIIITALGGLRAVVYTDSFSLVIMIFGLVVTVIKGYFSVGNFSEVWESAGRKGRLTAFDMEYAFRPDITSDQTVYTACFGSFTYYLLSFGANQLHIHRCLSCRSEQGACRAIWISVPLISLLLSLALVVGLYVSRLYEHCDPLTIGAITQSNQLYPLFVMDAMSDVVGLPGIFMAGLFSSTLSTVSSGLNSIAAVALEDCFRIYFWNHIGEGRARLMIQIITVFFGMICLELAYFADRVAEGLYQADQVLTAAIGSPLIGVFMLGLFFPRANAKGALVGMLGATALNIAMFYMKQGINLDEVNRQIMCINNCNQTLLTKELLQDYLDKSKTITVVYNTETNFMLQVSSRYYGPLGLCVTIVLGLVVSALTGCQDLTTLEPALIAPVFDVLFPLYFLPESIRERFRCGLDHTDKWARYHKKMEEEAARLKAEKKKKEEAMRAKNIDIYATKGQYAQTQEFQVRSGSSTSADSRGTHI